MAGVVAYRLALPPNLSDVHIVFCVSTLWKYTPDLTHVVDLGELVVDADGTFEKGPVCVMDSRDQVLQRKTVSLVKVLWKHQGVDEETWEREGMMRTNYPCFIKDEGTLSSYWIRKWL